MSSKRASATMSIAMDRLPGPPEKSRYFPLLRHRILHRHIDKGWEGLVTRVQQLAIEAESLWHDDDPNQFVLHLGEALRSGAFLPNSPLLVNSGNDPRRLFACFAVDSRRPHHEFLSIVRSIHDGMGGVGYSLDAHATSTQTADFIRRVDRDTVLHQDGRPRPASCAMTASIEAPGSDALIDLAGSLATTSLNIGISDEFMARDDGDAADKLYRLALTIHRTGQPGIVFTDRFPRIARDAAAPFATNVCGEAPLAADESGVLGSINLLQCLALGDDGGFAFDEARFTGLVRLAVRFLDGMLDLHEHPHPLLQLNSLATRKIGVGVMGFAHFLALLGVRYGDRSSIDMATLIAAGLSAAAQEESKRLARARGRFPAWHARLPAHRNASLAAIAGTSTLALLIDTTGGIEPVFSHVIQHRVMGETIVALDPIVEILGKLRGISAHELERRLLNGEPLSVVVGEDVARVIPLAHEIPGEQHIEVQAAFQREIDGGITKTLNCSSDSSIGDITRWLRLAHQRGCMGLTIYRDGARLNQPMARAG